MGVFGWLSSTFALKGVTWVVSSQSKSKVSLNPSEVLSLLPCGGGAFLERVAERSLLLERALGLDFSHGFLNWEHSTLRPRSTFRVAGSVLVQGCCWAFFLLTFLCGTGSGVECWKFSVSVTPAASGSDLRCGKFKVLSLLQIGLPTEVSISGMVATSQKDCRFCTRSDRLVFIFSVRWRRVPTVEGKMKCSSHLDCSVLSASLRSGREKGKS